MNEVEFPFNKTKDSITDSFLKVIRKERIFQNFENSK